MCVCVCACARIRASARARVCVCVHAHACDEMWLGGSAVWRPARGLSVAPYDVGTQLCARTRCARVCVRARMGGYHMCVRECARAVAETWASESEGACARAHPTHVCVCERERERESAQGWGVVGWVGGWWGWGVGGWRPPPNANNEAPAIATKAHNANTGIQHATSAAAGNPSPMRRAGT